MTKSSWDIIDHFYIYNVILIWVEHEKKVFKLGPD